jgi:transcription initiation factor TFIID subunit 15
MFVQQFQGNLIVTLKDSVQAIDDNEVRRKFQQFGDVKSVTPVGDRAECVVSISTGLAY